jgi:hypothetical protein
LLTASFSKMRRVGCARLLTDEQGLANFHVGQSGQQLAEDFPFAPGQALENRILRPRRHAGEIEHRLTEARPGRLLFQQDVVG